MAKRKSAKEAAEKVQKDFVFPFHNEANVYWRLYCSGLFYEVLFIYDYFCSDGRTQTGSSGEKDRKSFLQKRLQQLRNKDTGQNICLYKTLAKSSTNI